MSEKEKLLLKAHSINKTPLSIKREATKKSISFTLIKRDLHLLEQLNSYGVFSTQQIREFMFNGIDTRTVLRRLRLLKERGWLLSSEGLTNGGLSWFLTKKGAGLFHPSAYTKSINKNTLRHDVTLSDVRIQLEKKDIAFYWEPEHLLKRKALKTLFEWEESLSQVEDPPVVPDGLFIIKHQGKLRSVALELETSVKSVKRYRKLFTLYRDKEELFLLWYVVLNKSVGESLLKLWYKYTENCAFCSFSYSTLEDIFREDFKLPIPRENRE